MLCFRCKYNAIFKNMFVFLSCGTNSCLQHQFGVGAGLARLVRRWCEPQSQRLGFLYWFVADGLRRQKSCN